MAARNIYQQYSENLGSPVANGAVVTPSDTDDLTIVSRGIYVGVTGDLKITTKGGSTFVWASVAQGWHPVELARVWATGTTASDITAWW